ncbi:PSD1 and planctomycete cytochrome C domain-containing protein [Stieleria sp. ICT_E10.1]|uniref:PSD1 and planctomycete cytochrome C domain-containing protein n=1 Tax=Stieleria sedimenti TaxID=2976331 RepID=UPI00217FC787|nr:PSD1 and planctomycete cytochrome C domain-containing protein [Stieleria sedimenti]MCS7465420.1 PSD1 and planctomycete cytochrome C domain-containing protein [Stieleria sedimenti]
MKSLVRLIAYTILIVIGFVSHSRLLADDGADAKAIAYFETHIRPLLASRCYSCHSARSGNEEGGLVLDTRDGWMRGGDQGVAIVPGDADASLLIRAVRYSDPDMQMPPDKALPAASIAHLERWVEIGAPDPREPKSETEANVFAASDPIAGRRHWAYQPLKQVPTEQIASASERPAAWSRGAIDRFIIAKLNAANLTPAPDADPEKLARRLFIQLVGLPPTPDQLADFLSDGQPAAVERLVDRLLASPQFGQRWGRHWLDLARYADSNGLDENFLFREAWRYRNQVIGSFNSDTPLDQLLREQIAGDLLPYETIAQRDRQRIAAGFLVIGPKVLLIDKESRMQQRMDIADELIDTVGKAVLGQTVGCARCHDHKFDPIPTSDYYALAGILASTQVLEERQMLNQTRVMERLAGIGPKGKQRDDAYERYWIERGAIQKRVERIEHSLKLLRAGDQLGLLQLDQNHDGVLSPIALNHCRELSERVAAQEAMLDQGKRVLNNPPPIPPRAMVPADIDRPADQAIRLAGQVNRPGPMVPRGFLSVLTDREYPIPQNSSGRLELANWLTDTHGGAGHLAARVFANRVWHHLMGRGIVRTVDNFGRTGEEPSHPELLDHLASELIESGWSVKSLVRSIVLSRTFAMSSRHDDHAYSIDPDNQLLWRAHRRRMDPETFRDAMLQASGTLDFGHVDSTVDYLGDQATAVGANKNRRRTDFPCRSVYLPVIRNDLPELFDVFDFADPQATTGMRTETMVGTQGLFVLNDVSMLAASDAIARRLMVAVDPSVGADSRRVDQLYQWVVGQAPPDDELEEVLAVIGQLETQLQGETFDEIRLRAWSVVSQALFASSRFQIIE